MFPRKAKDKFGGDDVVFDVLHKTVCPSIDLYFLHCIKKFTRYFIARTASRADGTPDVGWRRAIAHSKDILIYNFSTEKKMKKKSIVEIRGEECKNKIEKNKIFFRKNSLSGRVACRTATIRHPACSPWS